MKSFAQGWNCSNGYQSPQILRRKHPASTGIVLALLSALLADKVGLESGLARAIEAAARLHDIGKLSMPDRILFSSLEAVQPSAISCPPIHLLVPSS